MHFINNKIVSIIVVSYTIKIPNKTFRDGNRKGNKNVLPIDT